jgi:NADP-dependent 3-hydroxy acid dehydrogenase YdfG
MKKLVVITGASSGIGAAAAREFSAAGHPLLLIARRLEKMESLGLKNTLCRQVDILNVDGFSEAIKEAESQYGPVDLLINNAGYMNLEDFKRQDPKEWKQQFEVNVIGLLNCTSAVFPDMIKRKCGTILNVGSTAGRNLYEYHTTYNGTKHAVHALSEGLRREGAPHGVRVIVIAPGMVASELLVGTTNPKVLQGYYDYRDLLLGGLEPEDISRAMLFAYNQPQELCIWEMVVAPTRQRS